MDSVPRPMLSNVIQILFKKKLDCDVNLTDCRLCFDMQLSLFESIISTLFTLCVTEGQCLFILPFIFPT